MSQEQEENREQIEDQCEVPTGLPKDICGEGGIPSTQIYLESPMDYLKRLEDDDKFPFGESGRFFDEFLRQAGRPELTMDALRKRNSQRSDCSGS